MPKALTDAELLVIKKWHDAFKRNADNATASGMIGKLLGELARYRGVLSEDEERDEK